MAVGYADIITNNLGTRLYGCKTSPPDDEVKVVGAFELQISTGKAIRCWGVVVLKGESQ